jgi:hypothetical protein
MFAILLAYVTIARLVPGCETEDIYMYFYALAPSDSTTESSDMDPGLII